VERVSYRKTPQSACQTSEMTAILHFSSLFHVNLICTSCNPRKRESQRSEARLLLVGSEESEFAGLRELEGRRASGCGAGHGAGRGPTTQLLRPESQGKAGQVQSNKCPGVDLSVYCLCRFPRA